MTQEINKGLIVQRIKMQGTTALFAIILSWLSTLRERFASAPRKAKEKDWAKTRLEFEGP